jgi:Zn-dependent protease
LNFDLTTVRNLVIVLVPMILSLSVHEFAHAWSAFKLGDDTAASQGRMTLNPLAHIDVIGTLVIPAFAVLNGGFALIGWAKPVPVSPQRFRRSVTMRNGMIVTALAGPASNLIMAFAAGGAYQAIAGLGLLEKGSIAFILFERMFLMNLGLAVFNMLPLPPLDGSRLLPISWQAKLGRFYIVTFIVLLVLINRFGFIMEVPIIGLAHLIIGFWSLIF